MRSLHHNLLVVGLLVAILCLVTRSQAQDTPGISAGAFFENRTDSKVGGDELSFNYYGVRFKVRAERYIEGFVDLGSQSIDWQPYKASDAGSFGLGGIFWLLRSEDGVVPADVGVYGSYHVASYTLKTDAGTSTDAKYSRYMVQGIVRGFEGGVAHPYLRAGIMNSNLEPDDEQVISSDDLKTTKPAVNVGVDFNINESLVFGLEGNYSEGVGGAVHLDYWF